MVIDKSTPFKVGHDGSVSNQFAALLTSSSSRLVVMCQLELAIVHVNTLESEVSDMIVFGRTLVLSLPP